VNGLEGWKSEDEKVEQRAWFGMRLNKYPHKLLPRHAFRKLCSLWKVQSVLFFV